MEERKWQVYHLHINRRQIETFNIFDHYMFAKGCDKAYKKFKHSKDDFAEEVRHELMYYFWSKCEWEVEICDLWREKGSKIDVYQQVMLNWTIFIDYLWNYCNNK